MIAFAEHCVEFGVAETDSRAIFYGATVINFVNISPENGGEAHETRLAGSVELAAG